MRTVVNNNYVILNNVFYAAAQNVLAGGNVVLNTNTTSLGGVGGIVNIPDWAYQLHFSVGSGNNINFTVTGINDNYTLVTETVACTSGGVATSVGYYFQILNISVDLAATNITVGITNLAISAPFWAATGTVIDEWALQATSNAAGTITFTVQKTNYPIKNLIVNPTTYTNTFGTTSVWETLPYYISGVSTGVLTYAVGSGITLSSGTPIVYISQNTALYALRVQVTANGSSNAVLSLAFTQQGTL